MNSLGIYSKQPFFPNGKLEVYNAKENTIELFKKTIDKSTASQMHYIFDWQAKHTADLLAQATKGARTYSKTLHPDFQKANGIEETLKLGEDAFEDMHKSAAKVLNLGQLGMFDEAVKGALVKEIVSGFKKEIVTAINQNQGINTQLLDEVDMQFKKTLFAKDIDLNTLFSKVTPAADGLTLSTVIKAKIGKGIDRSKIAELKAEKAKINKNHPQVQAKFAQLKSATVSLKEKNKEVNKHEKNLAQRSVIIQAINKDVRVNSTMNLEEIQQAIKTAKKQAIKEAGKNEQRKLLIKAEFKPIKKLGKKLAEKESDFQKEIKVLQSKQAEVKKLEGQTQGLDPKRKQETEGKIIAEIQTKYQNTIVLLEDILPKKGEKEGYFSPEMFWKGPDTIAQRKMAKKAALLSAQGPNFKVTKKTSYSSSSDSSSSSSSSSSSDDSSSESD